MKREVRSDWARAILVCGKCSKKSDWRLARLLRGVFGKGRRAAVGVVETKCLGICPKRGIVVVDAARPGRWRIVAPGTPVADVIADLDQA